MPETGSLEEDRQTSPGHHLCLGHVCTARRPEAEEKEEQGDARAYSRSAPEGTTQEERGFMAARAPLLSEMILSEMKANERQPRLMLLGRLPAAARRLALRPVAAANAAMVAADASACDYPCQLFWCCCPLQLHVSR